MPFHQHEAFFFQPTAEATPPSALLHESLSLSLSLYAAVKGSLKREKSKQKER